MDDQKSKPWHLNFKKDIIKAFFCFIRRTHLLLPPTNRQLPLFWKPANPRPLALAPRPFIQVWSSTRLQFSVNPGTELLLLKTLYQKLGNNGWWPNPNGWNQVLKQWQQHLRLVRPQPTDSLQQSSPQPRPSPFQAPQPPLVATAGGRPGVTRKGCKARPETGAAPGRAVTGRRATGHHPQGKPRPGKPPQIPSTADTQVGGTFCYRSAFHGPKPWVWCRN